MKICSINKRINSYLSCFYVFNNINIFGLKLYKNN